MKVRRARSAPALAALVVGGLVVVSLTTPARAESPGAQPPDDPTALFLLAVAQRAPASVGYAGVQYVTAWGPAGTASQVVDVTHSPKVGTVVHVRGTPGAPGREVFTTAGDDATTTPGSVTEGPVALLAGNYTVTIAGKEHVAGRECTVVDALRDGGARAARFWLDDATGLMLRREVFDDDGAVIKASAFVDIYLGSVRLDTAELPPAMPKAWGELVPTTALAALGDEGWAVPPTLPPGLDLYDVRKQASGTGPILHLSYSDGLSTVSVFQQRGHLAVDKLEGHRTVEIDGSEVYLWDGIPYRASWSADGVVYTVLADAPEDVARAVITALPRDKGDDGMMARAGRGIGRVASWFNPFG